MSLRNGPELDSDEDGESQAELVFNVLWVKLFWVNIQIYLRYMLYCLDERLISKLKIFFSIIFQHWVGTGSWNPSLWEIRTHLSYKVNIMVADDLTTQGASASAVMLLACFIRNIPASAPESLTNWCLAETRVWQIFHFHANHSTSCLCNLMLLGAPWNIND